LSICPVSDTKLYPLTFFCRPFIEYLQNLCTVLSVLLVSFCSGDHSHDSLAWITLKKALKNTLTFVLVTQLSLSMHFSIVLVNPFEKIIFFFILLVYMLAEEDWKMEE
jgi:hypothetical protein